MRQSRNGIDKSQAGAGCYSAQLIDSRDAYRPHANAGEVQLGGDEVLALIGAKEIANERTLNVEMWFDPENGEPVRHITSFLPRD